jgi:PrtD family type I secretion system ABC transporter
MRWLLVERLRPFVLTAFVAACTLNLALTLLAIYVLLLFDRVSVLSVVVLIAALVVYAADRLRGGALALACRAFDRVLTPAAIANSLDTLRDIRLLRSFIGSPAMIALLDTPWVLLNVLAIAWIHPQLGFAALLGTSLLVFVLARMTGLGNPERSDWLLGATRAADDAADDLVRGSETLAAMAMSRAAITAWRGRHERFLSGRQRKESAAVRLGASARAGSIALLFVTLGLGVGLVLDEQLSVVGMIAVALLLAKAMHSLEQLVGTWPAIAAAHAACLRLSRRSSALATTGLDAPTPAGSVELERVCYAPSAGRPAAIKNVTLTLAPGESVLIAGPSGSGKTTLARLLLGILRPQSGTARLDDTDLARWDRAALGGCVGYVPQYVQLFPGTIAENIARMGTVDSNRVVQAARLAHAHEMIVRLPEGYHSEVCGPGAWLAAGQRRRIALARALYVNPRLLVLDEPNADLDGEGELALTRMLAELKESRTTVVIVERGIGLLAHVDRLGILREGSLELVERMEAVRSDLAPPLRQARSSWQIPG